MERNTCIKQIRIRKYLRNKYKMNDEELDIFIIMKHHLNHKPTREELFKLEYYGIPVF